MKRPVLVMRAKPEGWLRRTGVTTPLRHSNSWSPITVEQHFRCKRATHYWLLQRLSTGLLGGSRRLWSPARWRHVQHLRAGGQLAAALRASRACETHLSDLSLASRAHSWPRCPCHRRLAEPMLAAISDASGMACSPSLRGVSSNWRGVQPSYVALFV